MTKPSKDSIPSGKLAESLSAERTRLDKVLELVEPWKIVRDNSSTVVPEKKKC